MLEQDPETGRIVYDGNITMAEAMAIEPRILYAMCVDSSSRPPSHKGDWPETGRIYPIRVLKHPKNGMRMVAVLGFFGEYPFYNVFSEHRFQHVATFFPN